MSSIALRIPRRPLASSLLTLAGLVCALALGTPGARGATPERVYLTPSGDTYTSAVSPHHSFGRATKLRVDAAPRQDALLRFNLSGVDLNRFVKATLYLYPLNSSPRGLAIRRGSRRYWHEAKLTYAKRKRLGATVARTGAIRAREWKAVDVSRLINGQPVLQIALTNLSRQLVVVSSREGRYTAPRLVLEEDPAMVAATPTTSAPTKVVMAVGDTCSSGGSPECAAVGDVIRSQHPDAFLHLGDMQYQDGNQSAFDGGYGRIFSDLHSITYPVFGSTHDFGWSGYPVSFMNQHSAAAGKLSDNQWGYSFDVGAWHVVALNYNHPDPAALEADLAAHPSRCLMAFDHAPYLGTPTSTHPSNELSRAFAAPLFSHGVDVMLNGHNHVYERLAPQNIDKAADPNGAVAFQVGTGGIGHYSFTSTAPNSLVQSTTAFGALRLALSPTGWTSQYINAPGSSLTDTASGSCGPPGS